MTPQRKQLNLCPVYQEFNKNERMFKRYVE